jgi:hypothetical protein
MKIFRCQRCQQVVYFENTQCMNCGTVLGFLPERFVLSALEPADGARWRPLAAPAERQLYRMCRNYAAEQVCNWLLPDHSPGDFCTACRFNQTIPDLSVAGNKVRWAKLEAAKHRLIYGLLRLGLPLIGRQQDPVTGLAFAFLADPEPVFAESARAMTGHAQGLITLNIAEADDAARERQRQALTEPYRTLLGHFRHESGHYYWHRLARDPGWLANFRALFGDERQDYGAAMQRNYNQGPPADWQSRFVSAYAAAHPWEDWAETWAHYLHIVDVLETAWVFRLRVSPGGDADDSMRSEPGFDPYRAGSLERLIDDWLPLTYAVNSLNRSMGLPDLYPFVLSPPVLSRLGFVHESVRRATAWESFRPRGSSRSEWESENKLSRF